MQLPLYEEGTTFKPEELSIIFDVPIKAETVLYDGSPFESSSETYKCQRNFVEQFCPGDTQQRVIPVDISATGVTLLTAYNSTMQNALPHLLEAMSLIAGVEVTYSLQTSDTWQDVTFDFNLGTHRLMTGEELRELYSLETWCYDEPVIYM